MGQNSKPDRHSATTPFLHFQLLYSSEKIWHELSKLRVNQPEEKLLESSSPPRLLASRPHPLEVLRSLTDTDLELSLCEKSDDTRSPLSFSSASSPSSVSSEKSRKISRLIFASSLLLSELFRKLPKRTSSVFSKTQTCAPSTPSESPSCQRTFSSPDESEENELKLLWSLSSLLFFRSSSRPSKLTASLKLSRNNILNY